MARSREEAAAAMRAYRSAHPERALIQRMRDARSLLEKHGFEVSGGTINLDNLRTLEAEAHGKEASTNGEE